MFRCSDTTFVTFENRNFLFSRLTLFLLYLYSVFKVHPDFFKPVSGDNEIRTRDPLLARQVLSQLSYAPLLIGGHLLSHAVSSIVPSAA